MAPSAEFEFPIEARIALLCIPKQLHLAKQKRRIVDAKIDAVPIAKLGVLRPGTGGVAVKDRAQQGEIVGDIGAQARPDRGKRRGGATAWHIQRQADRPSQRGIGEDVGVFRGHELGVSGKLPGAEGELGAPLLLEPHLVKPRGWQRLDAADIQKIEQGPARKASAMNLEEVGMERELAHAGKLFKVDIDGEV